MTAQSESRRHVVVLLPSNLGTILFCIPSLAFAETNIRLASWNIANFHHHVDVELREGIGTKRQQADFEALKRYAEGLAADVVALQEVGTQEAVARLFPRPISDFH
ncbi:hypothetical protein NKK52_31920 [Mesorhizobium sp. C277A]|uniref:hypothetical protein n=1 Tax=Mesorhizobium sp. C277A TaxID=2956827 RepID=UPI003338B1DD